MIDKHRPTAPVFTPSECGWVSIISEERLKRILHIPIHIMLVGYLCMGYPVPFESKPELETFGWLDRLPLCNVVFDETWGNVLAAD